MYVHGRSYPGGRSYLAERDDINRVVVAPSYFATMGIPLVTGRGFTERDTRKAPEVAIINEAAARKFFPNENPVGRRFGARPENSGPVEIVGVLRDVRYNTFASSRLHALCDFFNQSGRPRFSVSQGRSRQYVADRSLSARSIPTYPIVTVETQMSLWSPIRMRRGREGVTTFRSIAFSSPHRPGGDVLHVPGGLARLASHARGAARRR